MAERRNALGELTRFWLEARHGCLLRESVAVAVPNGWSDIDFVAIRPDLSTISLPTGEQIGPRMIVESKDEHDFDKHGTTIGNRLLADLKALGKDHCIQDDNPHKAHFSMLRQQHFDVAKKSFGTDKIDRLFVVHAVNKSVRKAQRDKLNQKRIFWITVRELVADLQKWYHTCERPTALRHTLMGDLFHLLVGYCEMRIDT